MFAIIELLQAMGDVFERVIVAVRFTVMRDELFVHTSAVIVADRIQVAQPQWLKALQRGT